MAIRAPAAATTAPDPSRLARAGLATFFRIAAEWDLDTAQQMALLGLPSRTTFFRWKKAAPASLPPDTLERLSHVFGIYKSLQILLPPPRRRPGSTGRTTRRSSTAGRRSR